MDPTRPKHLEAALQEYASHFDDRGHSLDGKKYLVIDKGNNLFQVVEKMGFFQSLFSLLFGNAPYTKKETDKYALSQRVYALHTQKDPLDSQTGKAVLILLKKLNVPQTVSTSHKPESKPEPNAVERPSTPSSTTSTTSTSSQQRETFVAQLKQSFPKTYKELMKTQEEIKLPSMDDRESLSTILDEIDDLKDAGKTKEATTLRGELAEFLQTREEFGKGPSYQ